LLKLKLHKVLLKLKLHKNLLPMKKSTFMLISLTVLGMISFQTAKSQSSGVTAPEYISFEPVDVTDMVNAMSGDFSYSVPLINIPSPEGGYPMALSYHAGITLEEESSWVGLGWTLNAGAINRFVNGVPDDSYEADLLVHDTWSGGSTYQYGLLIPLPYGVGVNLGFSNDTYTGFSLNSVGVSYSGFSMNIGQDGWSAGYNGSFNSIGDDFKKLNYDYNSELNENSELAKEMDTWSSWKSIGVTISSGGYKNIKHYSKSTEFNTSPKVLTKTYGEFNSNFYSQKRTRYWIDSEENFEQIGILNASLMGVTPYPNTYSFDRYILRDDLCYDMFPDKSESLNPELTYGASFPAYDIYSVTGQGIGGNMQPLVLDNGSLSSHPKTNLVHFLADLKC
jgi:hypothetical protein